MGHAPFILASASPRRLDLLAQIQIRPDKVIPADIDESPQKGELPHALALRLAVEKTQSVHLSGQFTLGADTVVGVGRRILPKAETEADARACLALLSGRAHRVTSGVCVLDPTGVLSSRAVTSRVQFKRLTPQDIDTYIQSGEWHGKAGGYAIQGFAGAFVRRLSGSYSAIVGLPLYESRNLLLSAGYTPRTQS